jgi:hypothetical protein
MSYAHTTRGQLRAALTTRLGVPNDPQWTTAELDLYIADTLSKWGVMVGSHRDRGQFHTTPGVGLYDIYDLAELSSLIGFTRTDRYELGIMQYLLREPYEPVAGVGMSDQFAFGSLVSTLQRSRDRLNADASMSLSQIAVTVIAGTSSVPLPDTAINVRRAVWLSSDGAWSNLHLSDEHEAYLYNALYTLDEGPPQLYSVTASPQLSLRLIPPPSDDGTLTLIVPAAGAALDPTAPTILGIPDDTTWIARALALSDLLARDGPAHNPSGADYWKAEYQLGLALVALQPQVLAAEINGVPIIPSSIADIDLGYSSPHWQNTTGSPTDLGVLDNFIALRPVPDGSYSVILGLVANADQPQSDSDYIQVGREDIDAILDGAQALAMFKTSGASYDSKILAQQMLMAAVRYNSQLSTLGYSWEMARISTLDLDTRPESGSGRGTGTIGPVDTARARQQQSSGNSGEDVS